jgi:hypothetical protein
MVGRTDGGKMKKPYEKLAILLTEKVEARAVECAKSGESCLPGPITS